MKLAIVLLLQAVIMLSIYLFQDVGRRAKPITLACDLQMNCLECHDMKGG